MFGGRFAVVQYVIHCPGIDKSLNFPYRPLCIFRTFKNIAHNLKLLNISITCRRWNTYLHQIKVPTGCRRISTAFVRWFLISHVCNELVRVYSGDAPGPFLSTLAKYFPKAILLVLRLDGRSGFIALFASLQLMIKVSSSSSIPVAVRPFRYSSRQEFSRQLVRLSLDVCWYRLCRKLSLLSWNKPLAHEAW